MVGNHLGRDIKGANALGLTSVWLDWAPRRAKAPADATEQPDFTIKTPLELLELIDRIEGGARLPKETDVRQPSVNWVIFTINQHVFTHLEANRLIEGKRVVALLIGLDEHIRCAECIETL